MATRAQKTKVGIFLLVGFAVIISVFVIIIRKDSKPTDTYFVKFEESVGGLKTDSSVLYKGVQVGKVKNICVKDVNEIIVRVAIERDLVTLREGTIAKIAMGSLMGGKVVELAGGKSGAPVLKPGSYISSVPSVMGNLAKDIPQILDEIKQILGNLNQVMGKDNSNRVESILKNADQSIISLNTTMAELEKLIQLVRSDLSDHGYELRNAMLSLQKAMNEAAQTFQFFRDDPSSITWGRSKSDNPYVK
ncbi:MAG TPA: MCE family protein [Proteobacteria bacterium]|nr:MCE family protein [Pseudomonadota bacterium]